MRLFFHSNHPFAHWWRCIDQGALFFILALFVFSAAISVSASAAVAGAYDVDVYYFARRQAMFLLGAFPIVLVASFLSVRGIKYFGSLIFVFAALGVVLTLLGGVEVKGAQRWVDLGAFRLQPSELLKPSFVIITAWFMAAPTAAGRMRGFFIVGALLGMCAVLLLLQPDFGMFMVLSMLWFGQMFLAQLATGLLLGLLGAIFLGVGVGYVVLPHVRSRIARFLDPASGDSYQIDRAQQAFTDGGLFGRGPGEGIVKSLVPDAHTDFILSVIAEEFGIITCLLLLTLYALLLFRFFKKLIDIQDKFTLLAGGGLLFLFGAQVLINMGVVLGLLPTTGMTLPFVSYGGSAMLSSALTAGFLLALTRRIRQGTL